MSDALNYLIAARPDAILPYFKFLKEAGKRLDIRTRDLISIITKVDVQTEGGFRQYLTRALRNGASPNEVLDALLMAFPTLGLAKIVWAVDILLDMDIPEFRPENLFAESTWHTVTAMSELPSGEISSAIANTATCTSTATATTCAYTTAAARIKSPTFRIWRWKARHSPALNIIGNSTSPPANVPMSATGR